MNSRQKAGLFVPVLLLAALLTPHFAYAYLDLGTGSFILQTIAAGFVASLVGIRVYWRKFISLFSRRKSDSNSNEGSEAISTDTNTPKL